MMCMNKPFIINTAIFQNKRKKKDLSFWFHGDFNLGSFNNIYLLPYESFSNNSTQRDII